MQLIDEFIEQYKKQYDFYSELARMGCKNLESELSKRGIKAIVSSRAKRPDRLKDKLRQRTDDKKYTSLDDIYKDIVDLAGVRVALYFPSDRDLVDEIVNNQFNVLKTKVFPETSHKPKHSKRFSGYWASHYRVTIEDTEKDNDRYKSTQFEIQVASVLMHAWSEVEHDLVYKPLSGSLSDEELSILDEINGLVLTGEIALERLQKAMTNRTKESNNISNRYELTSFIVNSLNKNYISKLKLGDTKNLHNYIQSVGIIKPETLSKYISMINQGENETISDQLLTMFIRNTYNDIKRKNPLENYFKNTIGSEKDVSGFESFVKAWILVEKAVSVINQENDIRHNKYYTAKFEKLVDIGVITEMENSELNMFKRIRNNLLHGIETPPDVYLNDSFKRLKELTEKVINSISDENKRSELIAELINI
jgi:ppGpp synthetase/RelA/SpoT-type nucleotidyltranferase